MAEKTDINEQNRQIILEMAKEGKLPQPRPMTRKERRAFDKSGNNFYKPKDMGGKDFASIVDDATDWVLDNVYKGFNFDALPNNVCNAFAAYTVGLTYKDDLGAKN